jgi:hypothetical protein
MLRFVRAATCALALLAAQSAMAVNGVLSFRLGPVGAGATAMCAPL